MESRTPTTLAELVKSISVQVSASSKYGRFRRMYKNDRIAFLYDCIPGLAKTIAPYQLEILGMFDSGIPRVAVRGPHGLGKTTIAAVLTHHTVLTAEDDAKCPTTASAWRQLEKYLWPEIRKIERYLDWSEIGRDRYDFKNEFHTLSIKLNGGIVEAFAVASDDHNTIEGAHGTLLFYIFDEAKTIPRETWNAVEGAFSNSGNVSLPTIPTSTPMDMEVRATSEGLSVIHPTRIYNPTSREQINNIVNLDTKLRSSRVPIDISSGRDIVDSSLFVSQDNVSDMEDSESVVADSVNDLNVVDVPAPRATDAPYDSPDHDDDNATFAHGDAYDDNDGMIAFDNNELLPNVHDVVPTNNMLNVDVANIATNNTYVSPNANSRHTDSRPSIRSISGAEIISEAYAFAISTPGPPSGQFYDIHMRKPGYEDWYVRHVSVDEAIRAGRISESWVQQRAKQWGVESSIFQNRVLGEFADASEDGIIALSHVRAACERWKEWHGRGRKLDSGVRVLGVDVARFGEDATVASVRYAWVVSEIFTMRRADAIQVSNWLKPHIQGGQINIETDGGYGAAVYDILHHQDIPKLKPVIAGAGTNWKDRTGELKFINVRAAMWWNMRELLDPRNGYEIMLPPVDELIADLTTPFYEEKKDNVIYLESKDSIRARLGRSTDYGDAVCLSFWRPGGGGGIVF